MTTQPKEFSLELTAPAQKFVLRDYQQGAINDLRQGFIDGYDRQILAAGTGSGKTIICVAIAEAVAQRSGCVLFVVPSIQLAKQAVTAFVRQGLRVGILRGEDTNRLPDEQVLVASIQTLRDRINVIPDNVKLIVIDEVHIFHSHHKKLLTKMSAVKTIGLSATPETRGLGKWFSRVVPINIKGLIEAGNLVPFKCYGPSEPDLRGVTVRAGDYAEDQLSKAMRSKTVLGDIPVTWKRLGQGRPTIAFCVDRAHARELAEQFETDGIPAANVDGTTPMEDREQLYADLRDGRIKVLCSVMVLSIGFDLPEVSCCILARPTMSIALNAQQVGRVARLASGKSDAIVICHSGNIARHGLPADYVPPLVLDDGEQKQPQKRLPTKNKSSKCPECSFMHEVGQRECPQCGHVIRRPTDVETVDAEIIGLDGASTPLLNKTVEIRRWIRELVGLCKMRGMGTGWAWHKLMEKFGSDFTGRLWSANKNSPEAPSPEVTRWADGQLARHHIAAGKRRVA